MCKWQITVQNFDCNTSQSFGTLYYTNMDAEYIIYAMKEEKQNNV